MLQYFRLLLCCCRSRPGVVPDAQSQRGKPAHASSLLGRKRNEAARKSAQGAQCCVSNVWKMVLYMPAPSLFVRLLQENTVCEEVDLSDNYIEGEGAKAIATVLKDNMFIVNLVSASLIQSSLSIFPNLNAT